MTYCTVVKTKVPGGAWLLSLWGGDNDTYGAFRSLLAAELWLEKNVGVVPEREKVDVDHYYYEWPDDV